MTAAAAPRILCAGVAVLDLVFRAERFPAANEKAQAHAFASVVGGCAANAAIAIARLGGRAELATVLGAPPRDEVGDRILAGLAREGVGGAGIVRVVGATSIVSSIVVATSGDRSILTHCDERLFAVAADDPQALVAEADAVLADNWLPDLAVPICAAARRRGIPIVLDGDGPMPPDCELATLPTHVVFSAEGLRATSGQHDLDAALARMGACARGFVAVTDGENDIRWYDGAMVHRLPIFTVDAVDTLAAGDVFHGAFALALAEGRHDVEALRFAAAAAAVKCTRFGGGSTAPSRTEVEALLATADGAPRG